MSIASQSHGRIGENILYFARFLRAAGLPVGTGQVLDAINGVRLIGIESREDLYWCLFSQFITHERQRQLFDQAFHIFWRNPRLRERLMNTMLPAFEGSEQDEASELRRRLQEALGSRKSARVDEGEPPRLEIDASFTASPREVLQEKDFEQMSLEELAQAKQLVRSLHLPLPQVATRRFQPERHGTRIDMRATLRSALRGSAAIPLKFKRPRRRPPPLVVLVDISASMSQYSRMFMHFMHAISNDRDRVHSFVFGTRLTNISRHLRHRDVDLALDRAASAVQDWSGGTRIAACLADFNRAWSRRVLGQGAVVLLITDGLERDEGDQLPRQMERLQKSCRQLVWLNPLLRYEGFEPRAAGIRSMLPFVDEFHPAHNIASLTELVAILSGSPARQAA